MKNFAPTKYILAAIAFIWLIVGIFPLVCYCGESMRLIHGASLLYTQGYHLYSICAYQYDTQPLVTALLVAFKFILPFASVEQIYCLLTAIAAILFSLLNIQFVGQISGHRWQHILTAAVLLPETYACAMYPNTSVIAACIFMSALIMGLNKRYGWAIALLGLAPLIRLDITIVYPIIFALIWTQAHNVRKGLIWMAFLVATSTILLTIGGVILHTNPLQFLEQAELEPDFNYSSKTIYSIFAFYTLINIILLPCGAYIMLRQHKMPLLLTALVPIVGLHFFYRTETASARNFLYLIPFVMIITTQAIEWMAAHRHNRNWVYGALTCIVLYHLISIRADMPMTSKQWMNLPHSSAKRGPIWTLFQENITPYHISFGIGAGQLVPTNNEYMLLSGNFFYPWYIHNYKKDREKRIEAIREYIGEKGKLNLLTCSGEGHSFFINSWLNHGFRVEDVNSWRNCYIMYKENLCLYTFTVAMLYNDKEQMANKIEHYKTLEDPAYLITMHENEDMLAQQLADEGLITRVMDNLYKIK